MATTSVHASGRLADGRAVQAVTLANNRGHEATILTLGATLQALWIPDARGNRVDIVLGHDTPGEYLAHRHYFGCTVGRHANRIAQGRFHLDGQHFELERNDGDHHLHGGGAAAFHRQLWRIEEARDGEVLMALRSAAGAGGYPGRLDVTARHTLDDEGALCIEYGAVTDAPTIVNLTHHGYFNLRGRGDVMAHRLTLDASRMAPVDATLIPTGELRDVAGSPFDFRAGAPVGARIREPDPQLRIARGYDHHFVIDGAPGTLRRAARLEDPESGRMLELHITAAGVQFYSGNFLDGSTIGKGGVAYRRATACAWNRRDIPTRRTSRGSPPPGSCRGKPTAAACAWPSRCVDRGNPCRMPCRSADVLDLAGHGLRRRAPA